MAVEGIAASASAVGVQQNADQSAEQGRISELNRLEQDVQKLKSDFKNSAKTKGISQTEINSKIKKYEELIAKIEQEIRQVKEKESAKPVDLGKNRGTQDVYARGRDRSTLSIAALKASCRMLSPASDVISSADQEEDPVSDSAGFDERV